MTIIPTNIPYMDEWKEGKKEGRKEGYMIDDG
jgi:hypothetical protein